MSTTSQDFRTDQRNAGRLRKAVRQRSWTFIVILVIVLSLFSYLAGMYTISRDLAQTRLLLQALQTETQKARRRFRRPEFFANELASSTSEN